VAFFTSTGFYYFQHTMLINNVYHKQTMVWHLLSFIGMQSKFLKLHKEKVISVDATCAIHSFLVLFLVCNPDILDQSAPSSSWWRGWSRCSCVFSCILLPTLRIVHNVHVPKRSWSKSNSSLTVLTLLHVFCLLPMLFSCWGLAAGIYSTINHQQYIKFLIHSLLEQDTSDLTVFILLTCIEYSLLYVSGSLFKKKHVTCSKVM